MSVEIASRDNDFNNRQHKTSVATEVFIYKRGLFNGNLNDGKPFLRIFLIPDAIDIAGTSQEKSVKYYENFIFQPRT